MTKEKERRREKENEAKRKKRRDSDGLLGLEGGWSVGTKSLGMNMKEGRETRLIINKNDLEPKHKQNVLPVLTPN